VTVNVRPAIVSVPVRCVPVFAATAKLTMPLPVRAAPAVTVTHDALLAAVHEQADVVVTVVDPLAPAADAVSVDGEILKEHAPAAWFAVNVCPPIVSVPLRGWVVAFVAALNVTTPLPLPLAPPVTVSHVEALLVAVHAHPAGAVTLVVLLPPAAVTERLVGDSENVQLMPAWFAVNVCPPIVSVPVRACVLALAAALKVTTPLPLPLAPPVTVSQAGALLDAVHEHPVAAVTLVVLLPPAATIERLVGESA
jgi:hypothetical protein